MSIITQIFEHAVRRQTIENGSTGIVNNIGLGINLVFAIGKSHNNFYFVA